MITAIVVDDDVDCNHTLKDILEFYNVKVLDLGYDGEDAVKLFKKHRPDLLFLDIMMPDFDGFYALEKIKDLYEDSKIIFITGDMYVKEKLRTMKQKPHAVIFKPFSIMDIQKILREVDTIC